MLEVGIKRGKSTRWWNRCLYGVLTVATLVSNSMIMVTPIFGFEHSTNNAVQLVLASFNTLIKGLELQFQFGSKADSLHEPVETLEKLLIECTALLAAPSSLAQSVTFLKQVQEAIKSVCSHVDIEPFQVKECLVNSQLTQMIDDATGKVLAADADEDDLWNLKKLVGMTKGIKQVHMVEPVTLDLAESCLGGEEAFKAVQKLKKQQKKQAGEILKIMQDKEEHIEWSRPSLREQRTQDDLPLPPAQAFAQTKHLGRSQGRTDHPQALVQIEHVGCSQEGYPTRPSMLNAIEDAEDEDC